MTPIFQFVTSHGYTILFAAVFARQIGLPVPANLFVVAAGALAAAGRLAMMPVLLLAVIGCVVADWVWYEAGRMKGDKVLHLIHSFAPDPDAADRRAKERFAKHGPPLLLLSKFIPGLDLVAPPLAGTSRTSRALFLTFESAGAAMWAAAYGTLGYVFSHDLNRAAAYAGKVGTVAAIVLVAAVAIFAIRKLVQGHMVLVKSRAVRKLAPEEKLVTGETHCAHRQRGTVLTRERIRREQPPSDFHLTSHWLLLPYLSIPVEHGSLNAKHGGQGRVRRD